MLQATLYRPPCFPTVLVLHPSSAMKVPDYTLRGYGWYPGSLVMSFYAQSPVCHKGWSVCQSSDRVCQAKNASLVSGCQCG